jgi:hypothetical protein
LTIELKPFKGGYLQCKSEKILNAVLKLYACEAREADGNADEFSWRQLLSHFPKLQAVQDYFGAVGKYADGFY